MIIKRIDKASEGRSIFEFILDLLLLKEGKNFEFHQVLFQTSYIKNV